MGNPLRPQSLLSLVSCERRASVIKRRMSGSQRKAAAQRPVLSFECDVT